MSGWERGRRGVAEEIGEGGWVRGVEEGRGAKRDKGVGPGRGG